MARGGGARARVRSAPCTPSASTSSARPTSCASRRSPTPSPGPGRSRIAVAAAGVHLLDTSIRAGTSGGPFPLPELPMTPGREVAGVVDAVGEGVDAAWLGRRAVAHLGQASGGDATRAVREAEAVHEVPSALALPPRWR